MSRRKTNTTKKDEEKPKPIDRTQIYVALIGLVGTITVALIALAGNRTPEEQAAPPLAADLGATNAPSVPVETPRDQDSASAVSHTLAGCVDEYFTGISPENQTTMEVGTTIRIPIASHSENTLGPFGVQLTENGGFIGALQLLAFINSQSFKVTSVVDGDCAEANGFGNLNNPSKQNSIGNWENLQLQFTNGRYRLRMGLKVGMEIELILANISD